MVMQWNVHFRCRCLTIRGTRKKCEETTGEGITTNTGYHFVISNQYTFNFFYILSSDALSGTNPSRGDNLSGRYYILRRCRCDRPQSATGRLADSAYSFARSPRASVCLMSAAVLGSAVLRRNSVEVDGLASVCETANHRRRLLGCWCW